MVQDGQERLLEADEWLPQSEQSDSFVVCLFVLLGCGLLLPWNALITGESIIRLSVGGYSHSLAFLWKP